ncbi:MAG: hypothetical protein WBP11_10940 [Dokdonella sp.]
MNTNTLLPIALIGLIFAAPCAYAAAPASGNVGDWKVVDAIAWRDSMGTHVVVSDKPFDRIAIASDRKMDSSDVMSQQMNPLNAQTYELRLDAKGAVDGINISVPGGSSAQFSSEMTEGLKLSKNNDKTVAGSFAYDNADIRFDVPVVTGELPRPGKPLPADGGEPGKVLTAQIAAIAKGDFDALIKLSPPEHRASIMAAAKKDGGKMEMMAAQAFTPSKATVTGGSIEGDKAWLDFDGVQGGEVVKGMAILERADGAWYVRNIDVHQAE